MSRSLVKDASLSAVVAGVIVVAVGFSASAVIVFQAALAGHLSPEQTASWIWAIALGSGVTSLGMSLYYRVPILTAWSTPGAALLVTGLPQYGYGEAIGAYLVAAIIVTVLGLTGIFSKLMEHVPGSVVAAMLGGILFRFGVGLFGALDSAPWIVAPIIFGYLASRRFAPRYAVVTALVAGLIAAGLRGEIAAPVMSSVFTLPVWTTPQFSGASIIGLAIPLALVAMTSQNAPGVGVIRAAGYNGVPVTPLVSLTGLVSILTAPFGGHGITLAAITAAIGTSSDCHPDKDRRYVAGVTCGVIYLLAGIFGTAVTSLFFALPKALIAAIAGVALLTALGGGIAGAVHSENHRDAGLFAFLVTASGVSFGGVGSAFWGLLAGVAVHLLMQSFKPHLTS